MMNLICFDQQMRRSHSLIWILVFTCYAGLFTSLKAGEVQVSSTFEKDSIITGDQLMYTMQVDFPKEADVVLPLLSDTLSRSVEILESVGMDTLLLDEDRLRYKHVYKVTAFDSGVHVVHPKLYVIYLDSTHTDTLYDMPLKLTVSYMQADSADVIRSLSSLSKPGLTLAEIWPYLVLGVALILLAVLLWLYIRYYKKGKKPAFFEKPKVPAHILALEELDALQQKKLWQNNQYKTYWSGLSGIIRAYFEHRFGFPAMESVRDEIMDSLREYVPDQALQEKTREFLHTADMVKFAREVPLPDQNSRALEFAYDIVRTTMETNEDVESKDEKEST